MSVTVFDRLFGGFGRWVVCGWVFNRGGHSIKLRCVVVGHVFNVGWSVGGGLLVIRVILSGVGVGIVGVRMYDVGVIGLVRLALWVWTRVLLAWYRYRLWLRACKCTSRVMVWIWELAMTWWLPTR